MRLGDPPGQVAAGHAGAGATPPSAAPWPLGSRARLFPVTHPSCFPAEVTALRSQPVYTNPARLGLTLFPPFAVFPITGSRDGAVVAQVLLLLCGDTQGQAGPAEGDSSHHHLCCLKQRDRKSGAYRNPCSWGSVRTVPGPHPHLQIHPHLPSPGHGSHRQHELLLSSFQHKHLKNPVVQPLFVLGCLHAPCQGNQVVSRKCLAQGAARRCPLAPPQPRSPEGSAGPSGQ